MFHFTKQKMSLTIGDYLFNRLGIKKNSVSKSTCWHIWYGKQSVINQIFKFIYKDCEELYLTRKFEKFKFFKIISQVFIQVNMKHHIL